LKLAGRYATQAANRTPDPLTAELKKNDNDTNGKALFLSADWAVATDKQQRSNLHLLGDYLNVRADTKADPVKPDNFGGNRLSVGLGYDYAFTKNTKAAVQVKYFRVTEVIPGADNLRSDGVSVFGSLNHRF
jgi:predicted porin